MANVTFRNATVVFTDRIEAALSLSVIGGRIRNIDRVQCDSAAPVVDLRGQYLCPGFVDLHVHGGGGSDFMDLTPEAFRTVCRTHAKHGTTSLTPTSTVASEPDYVKFLRLCQQLKNETTGGARVVGSHLYGPYFLPAAKGCHPNAAFLTPEATTVDLYRDFDASFPLTVTIAPELPNAEAMTRACTAACVRVNIGHSYATMEQVDAAVQAGARHVDHLFCAMSDRARLRQQQTFPMRAGVIEATLFHDELTTEVIADGQHLNDGLLRLAYKVKGPGKLALVTDAMRAVDLPDGEYWFGPETTGERIRRMNNVGVTLEGTALASGVMGMDHCLRTMLNATNASLQDIVRMASLTPARIIGLDRDIGSIEVGKRADFVVMDSTLAVQQVYLGGHRIH